MRREKTIAWDVELTPTEMLDLGKRLAQLTVEEGRARSEMRDQNAVLKARVDTLAGMIRDAARALNKGAESREISAIEELNPETGKIITYRADTMEIIATRDASAEERQIGIFEGGGVVDAGGENAEVESVHHVPDGDRS